MFVSKMRLMHKGYFFPIQYSVNLTSAQSVQPIYHHANH